MEVNPEMIAAARLAAGLTQTECAKEINISQGQLSKVEDGFIWELPTESVRKFSEVTGYPVAFFAQTGSRKSLGDLFFRKRKTLPVKALKKCDALVNIKRIEIEKLLPKAEFDFLDRPTWEPDCFDGGPREIARHLRSYWGLPQGPILNLTRVVEDAGCFVFQFDFGSPKIDGLTTYADDGTPLIFMNPNVSAARYRATLAHEFGHVIMHRLPSAKMDDEAFEFAGEFMMPELEIRPSLFPLNLEKVINLKRRWRVSMGWILLWAKHLGALKDDYYRFLQMKLSQNGWRKSEPLDDEWEIEQPTLLNELIEFHLVDLGYSENELFSLLNANKKTFRREYLCDKSLHVL